MAIAGSHCPFARAHRPRRDGIRLNERSSERDANWPDWYAEYMVAEQAGKELPQ